jgi:hypothetical protein
MIRPLTIATCLLACGSGLYLYQSKHEVQLLDRTIERTVHDTSALREQSRLLAAEWTMLNDPERLRQFSDTYLNLKSIAPSQFTSLADLGTRLPAPLPEAPSHGQDEQELAPVVAEAAPPSIADPAAAAVVAEQDLPVPPIPATVWAPVARPADTRTADRVQVARPVVADNQARPVVIADARSSEQRPTEQRSSEQRGAPRVAEARADGRIQAAPPPRPVAFASPRPLPAAAPIEQQSSRFRPPVIAASAPYGGSLLGMARGSMPPAPRPTPVNAAYNAN